MPSLGACSHASCMSTGGLGVGGGAGPRVGDVRLRNSCSAPPPLLRPTPPARGLRTVHRTSGCAVAPRTKHTQRAQHAQRTAHWARCPLAGTRRAAGPKRGAGRAARAAAGRGSAAWPCAPAIRQASWKKSWLAWEALHECSCRWAAPSKAPPSWDAPAHSCCAPPLTRALPTHLDDGGLTRTLPASAASQSPTWLMEALPSGCSRSIHSNTASSGAPSSPSITCGRKP